MSRLLFSLLALLSAQVFADSQCGPFTVHWAEDGFARINGAKPETQKVNFLKQKDDFNNVKIQWMVPTNAAGKWYGMDFVGRDGKAILNVQLVQANMNAPRVYGTYDCKKVN
ncbi:hypothetical protein [Kosakonia oryziphila]|uniref:Uncharacterized protein n=1 Tax=Kosakonia oryziphila TaxID=1005667 RepID=A0A1C4GPW5_9ENTR|nr:hypothetical protein [Kosakonia oryziphila]SCC69801.1 hypothetical protein GA0061070_10972 [Kosakonia oryziphila]